MITILFFIGFILCMNLIGICIDGYIKRGKRF